MRADSHCGKSISCSSLRGALPRREVRPDTRVSELFAHQGDGFLDMMNMVCIYIGCESAPSVRRLLAPVFSAYLEKCYSVILTDSDNESKFISTVILLLYAQNKAEIGFIPSDRTLLSTALYDTMMYKNDWVVDLMVRTAKDTGAAVASIFIDTIDRICHCGDESHLPPTNQDSLEALLRWTIEAGPLVNSLPKTAYVLNILSDFLVSYHSRFSAFAAEYLLNLCSELSHSNFKSILDDYTWGVEQIKLIRKQENRDYLLRRAAEVYMVIKKAASAMGSAGGLFDDEPRDEPRDEPQDVPQDEPRDEPQDVIAP